MRCFLNRIVSGWAAGVCGPALWAGLWALASVASADGPPGAAETRPPDYSACKKCYRLPYGNAKPLDFDHLSSISVRASLNGGPPLRLQIDTGSTGVVVGAADVPNIDPNAPPGSITYSSSGIQLDGVWTPVTITFPDAKDENGNVATAVVPVLAVTERKIHPGAVNSGKRRPSKDPRPFMLGIGSGRGKGVHQEHNPWLNLKEMQAGAMRRGYNAGGRSSGRVPGTHRYRGGRPRDAAIGQWR